MKKIIIFLIAIYFAFECHSQQINIPAGTNPAIDGTISSNEWSDADSASIYIHSNWSVKVFFKHSDSCLYFAFVNLVSNYGQRYPDLLLDINNDKSNVWSTDDWWLHASYNDCEGNGVYNVWSSCQPTHPGWIANNFPLNPPGIIEIEVSYSKVGISNGSVDTLGIAFEVSDTYNDYHYYPSNATIANPSTWTTGVLSYTTKISGQNVQNDEVRLFPNPSQSSITIKFPNPNNEKYSLQLYDVTGQIVQKIENIISTEFTISDQTLEKGIYFFKLRSIKGQIKQGKFMIE